MVPEFDTAAFGLKVGETSDPVKTTYGYHVIQVEEKADNRPFDDTYLQQQRQKTFDDWLSQQRSSDPKAVQDLGSTGAGTTSHALAVSAAYCGSSGPAERLMAGSPTLRVSGLPREPPRVGGIPCYRR
jgi:hypothetical protein